MGNRCTKSSTKNVSENEGPQKPEEVMEEDESLMEQKSYDFNGENDLDENDLELEQENELEDEPEMKPLESRLSSKKSNVDPDSGLDPGLLPFQNSITSRSDHNTSNFSMQNSSVTLKSQSTAMDGSNSDEDPFKECIFYPIPHMLYSVIIILNHLKYSNITLL